MKRFLLSLLLLVVGLTAIKASPVFRTLKTLRQSDGTQLRVVRTGANHLKYFLTEDCCPIAQDSKGDFCYALWGGSMGLEPSSVIAHESEARTPQEAAFALQCREDFEAALKMYQLSRYGVGSTSSASVKGMGDVRVAVILAEFQDLSFLEENDSAKFDRHFNAPDYTDQGGAGSARQYFIDQSYGMFRPQFDVVGKVKVSHDFAYYGENVGSSDKNCRLYITEAVDSAIAKGVDFTPYLNEKGELFVVVIFPGEGEQVSGPDQALWAQYLYSMSHTNGSIKLKAALIMDELANYGNGVSFDGIGTFCHEFSHALGLPDFYATNGNRSVFGMDAFSLMDYGQYNKLSVTPVGYTAYEREFMGWLEITDLQNQKQQVELNPLHSSEPNRAFRIRNEKDASGNEYYILENRQESPWFIKTYGKGMLVVHVDYSANAWAANTINNNASRQRMTIIPADNAATPLSSKAADYKGDFFPGYNAVTELSSTSTPATTVYNGSKMDIKLKDIHEADGKVIFFYQCEGKLSRPKDLAVSQSSDGFSIIYNKVENAEAYKIRLLLEGEVLRELTVLETEVSFSSLEAEKEYSVEIVATAEDFLDSEASEISVVLSSLLEGDVDNDGKVNTADIVAIYNIIITASATEETLKRADVNKDGSVNTADVVSVYNLILGAK